MGPPIVRHSERAQKVDAEDGVLVDLGEAEHEGVVLDADLGHVAMFFLRCSRCNKAPAC